MKRKLVYIILAFAFVIFKLIKALILKPIFKLLSILITIGLAVTVCVSGFLYIYGNNSYKLIKELSHIFSHVVIVFFMNNAI